MPSAGMARVGAVQWRWTSRPLRAPVCPGCGEDVRVEGLAEGSVPCACGATLHVEPVPGPLQVDVPSAQWLFRLEEAPVAEGAPVAMGCPQCGANVILPGADERLARCGHCDAQVTVPEALWRALHPIRAAHPWTVRFEGPSRRTVEAQAADAARAEAEAADQARRVVEEAERARAVEAARVAAEAERVSAEAARAAEVTRLAAEAIRTRRIVVVGVVFCLLCVAFFVAVKG